MTSELRESNPPDTAKSELSDEKPEQRREEKTSAEEESPLSAVSLRKAVADGIGGVRGMVETTIPVVVFVAANIVWGLKPALWGALGVAIAIAVYRLIKRDSMRHALTGAAGVAFAAMIAAATGRAADFFLPGIITNFVYATAFVVSIFLKRPIIGYVWSLIADSVGNWREHPALVRSFVMLSWVWAGVFALRGGVQLWLYLADMTLGLGIVRILGIAPYAGAVAFTVWYGKRAIGRWKSAQPEPAQPEPVEGR